MLSVSRLLLVVEVACVVCGCLLLFVCCRCCCSFVAVHVHVVVVVCVAADVVVWRCLLVLLRLLFVGVVCRCNLLV